MPKLSLTVEKDAIVFNGVRYIPDPSFPNIIKVYLTGGKKGGHQQVIGATPTQVINEIRRIQKETHDEYIGVTVYLNHNTKQISNEHFTLKNLTSLRQHLNKALHQRLLKTTDPKADTKIWPIT